MENYKCFINGRMVTPTEFEKELRKDVESSDKVLDSVVDDLQFNGWVEVNNNEYDLIDVGSLQFVLTDDGLGYDEDEDELDEGWYWDDYGQPTHDFKDFDDMVESLQYNIEVAKEYDEEEEDIDEEEEDIDEMSVELTLELAIKKIVLYKEAYWVNGFIYSVEGRE